MVYPRIGQKIRTRKKLENLPNDARASVRDDSRVVGKTMDINDVLGFEREKRKKKTLKLTGEKADNQ